MADQGGPDSPCRAKGSASGQPPKPIPAQRGRVSHCVCPQTKAVYEPHVLISGMPVREQNNPSYVVLSHTHGRGEGRSQPEIFLCGHDKEESALLHNRLVICL